MRPIVLLCRLHDGLSDLGYAIGALGLASMAAIYCWEVLTRYFLNMAMDWANDTFSNVLCVTLFAMVPHATRRGQHIAITLLAEFLPATAPALRMFAALVGTVMCLFVGWMSLEENIRQITMEIVTPQNHPIPKWWMTVFITYGFLGAALYFLRSLFPHPALQPMTWITPAPGEAKAEV